jgi:beta-lactamase regulating signal transducer with metallopeptidase domain/predicted  nucleic acid-binding Zn-ribbon protein
MPTFILEAAFRSLLMALAVWTSIRLLRVQAVLAQKVAWVLVLVAAGTMPLVMRAPFLALDKAMRIPIRPFASSGPRAIKSPALEEMRGKTTGEKIEGETAKIERLAPTPKPSAGHLMDRSLSISPETNEESVQLAESSALTPDPSGPMVSDSSALSVSAEPSISQANASASLNSRYNSAQPPSDFWSWSRIKLTVVIAYLSIGGILLLRMLVGLAVAFRIWRRAEPITDLQLGAMDGFSQDSRVRASHDLATPVTIGSTVILPADYREWDAAKLRVVLAHERSHVHQGDFYLQLLAALHVAVFWFSPLGWWLQRKLSELGEALSDRAGLQQAPSAASYAQILLEFAAIPRTKPYFAPLAGVAMARSSNLSSRIERILNDRRFRLAFLGGRRHAFLTALLVPAALVAVVACIRIVPAVEAAQTPSAAPVTGQVSGQVTGQVSGQVTGQVSGSVADQVTTVNFAQAPAQAPVSVDAPALAPAPDPASALAAPIAPAPTPEAEPAPVAESEDAEAPEPSTSPKHSHGIGYSYSTDDDHGESFAIVRGKDSNTVIMSGHAGKELEKARQKYHGDFIWFERGGKSYVITDPAILAQGQALFKSDPRLEQRQKALQAMQANLDLEMAKLQPEIAKASLPGPEFAEQMAKLNAQLAELQSDKFKKLTAEIAAGAEERQKMIDKAMKDMENNKDLTDKINKQVQDSQQISMEALQKAMELKMEKLGDLQEKIGDIQGQIGEIQGKIGERQGMLGEKQGEIGERMGKVGEEMGKIGEQQGKMAEEAARKMKSVLDQAIKDGKATLVE